MAVRTPLVIVNGQVQQLQAGDTIPGGSAIVTLTTFTKDLGVGAKSGGFTLTGLSGLTIDKVVSIIQTAGAITSKGNARDESEMDSITVTGYVLDSSTIKCFWHATGIVVGTYEFAYFVSG